MPTLTVRYFAAAKAAAGCSQEQLALTGPATLGTVTRTLAERHGADLARVLALSSFLLDGAPSDPDDAVADGVTLDVLPPFAGG